MPLVVLLLIAAVKAALLIAAALLVAACVPRASAAMRHAILLTALIGAMAVPLLSAALPTLTPSAAARASSLAGGPEPRRWVDNALLLLMVRSDDAPGIPVRSTLRGAVERNGLWILALWLAGAILALARVAADLAAARRIRRRARFVTRVGAGIPLLESDEIHTPVVVGLWRPAILIPRGSARETAAPLGTVITHELAHVERRDCLAQLAGRVACAAYWFDPLVWWAARRIALERERACDDRVLSSGADPLAYSQLLLDMARRGTPALMRPQALPSMAQSMHLEKRIVSILTARPARRGPSRWRCAVAAIATSLIVVPVAALGVQDGPPRDAGTDPYYFPESERVEGMRGAVGPWQAGDPATRDGLLIETLRGAAAREPAGRYDLVPDRARWALSLARDGRLIEPLRGALQDPDWRVRGYAVWALSVAGDPGAVEPLIALLDDPVWRVRAMAASALRHMGGAPAAAAMSRVLHDPAWQVRVEAVAYLGALRDPRYRRLLEPLREDPHIAVRLAAGEALDNP